MGRTTRTEKGGDPVRHFTIHHDGAAIAVSRGGRGRPLVLCPGLDTTRAELGELVGLLRRDHDVVAFDLRGHGLSPAAGRYTFEAFLGDLSAVMARTRRPGAAPLLVGYSLGADLAVHYASENPDGVAGLVLIDGANPVPEPFVTEDLLPLFRAMWEDAAARRAADLGTDRQVLLTGREILDLNIEVDAIRARILDRYRRIVPPVTVIASASLSGGGAGVHGERLDRNWRAGIDRLVRELPRVAVTRLDADHRMPFTHAAEIARIIRGRTAVRRRPRRRPVRC